ncbi:hypothetical protein N657DRAFT_684944 [Parathielavia appendiculata]|uniref:Heterokaryon incompatibility domain-containing protein n=1 Tax=Parathielavia appendiculata TaxID=2587402 RepID=A0AAN6TR93_9PEZI|nr:hypothetical protein N657DRAFT_684944 [Parathielavia appendiculata]
MARPVISYRYSSLPDHCIRLLRLIPHWDKTAPLQCSLFTSPILISGRASHSYEALSYVWGSPERTHYVCIDNCELPVTASLHGALSRLRDSLIEKIVWVDAIYIDQEDLGERENQVQCIAEIDAKASRVLVWLGEEKDDSSHDADGADEPVLALLERPWFTRIWRLPPPNTSLWSAVPPD